MDTDKIISDIEFSIIEERLSMPRRDYLGFSEIGHKCARYLWFVYHRPEINHRYSANILRVFKNGEYSERRIIEDLITAGYGVCDTQTEFSLFDGKLKGHCDGVIMDYESGKKSILEIKTANTNRWKQFKKNGVGKTDYKYFVQCHMYCGCANGIDDAIIIIENKDSQELFVEKIEFDMDVFEKHLKKAHYIIESKNPPTGISNRKDWWECRFCPYNNEDSCRNQSIDQQKPF